VPSCAAVRGRGQPLSTRSVWPRPARRSLDGVAVRVQGHAYRRMAEEVGPAARAPVALGGAGPILGQYLCPVTASCGVSWPLPRVRMALLAIVWSELGRVRFPFSALRFRCSGAKFDFAGPITPPRGHASGVRCRRRARPPEPPCWRGRRAGGSCGVHTRDAVRGYRRRLVPCASEESLLVDRVIHLGDHGWSRLVGEAVAG
jgi:hypothetical protein